MKQKESNFVPAVEIENGTITVTIRKEVPKNIEEPKLQELDWDTICHAVCILIRQRTKHCEEQLAVAVANNETFLIGESGKIIGYRNGGHFSVPVYQAMTDFLSIENPFKIRKHLGFLNHEPGETDNQAKLLAQQALRQLIYIIDGKDSYASKEYDEVDQWYSPMDLSNILTEQLLLL